jgi:hypothetical protein
MASTCHREGKGDTIGKKIMECFDRHIPALTTLAREFPSGRWFSRSGPTWLNRFSLMPQRVTEWLWTLQGTITG